MKHFRKEVMTLPNMLTILRLILVPCFLCSYCVKHHPGQAAVVLLLSGVTDVADGYFARRFHQVSDLGKILDPVADKLTQGVVLLCLATQFPQLVALAVILGAKELIGGCFSLAMIGQTGKVESARWHGKLSALLLYGVMMAHLLYPGIPESLTAWMILLSGGTMLLSFVLYGWEKGKLYGNAAE